MACLKLSYFPQIWKQAQVIAIHKPGKDSSLTSSYRPISLLSSLSKILERVILKRINDHLSDNNILPTEQYGFRQKRSTTHQLNRIVNYIKRKYTINKSSTGMILLDIERAFDRVWHNGLLFKMINYNFPLYLTKIISSFLENRSFYVKLCNSSSQSKSMPFGLPQGAVLSPTLYNVFTADIPKSENCEIALFADDTSFFISSPYANVIRRNLITYSNSLEKYFKKWKVSLNMDKTQAIFFTKRRKLELPGRTIKIFNKNISWQNSAKYLGLILDKKLTFKNHIEAVIEKANKSSRILYPLLNRKSKLNLKNKLLLYKVALRPIITYACPIFGDAAKTHQKKMQTFQNKIIKIILNVPWYTGTNYIHQQANIMLVKEYMEKLNSKFNSQ
jgi:hypothetical protein